MKLESFVHGQWAAPGLEMIEIASAVSGDVVAQAASGGLDMRKTLDYARSIGGANLRRLTFHQRAALLQQALAILQQ